MGRSSNAKTRLIEAIIDLMWERSYGMVTIDQICQHADVKKGSFYYFYKSKTELTLDALNAYWEENIRSVLDSIFSPSKNGVQRLIDHADFKLQRTREIKEKHGKCLACCIFTVGQEMCNVDQELRDAINGFMEMHMRYFTTAVRDAASEGLIETDDIEGLANCIYSCFEGMYSRARITNDPEVMKDLKGSYLRILGVNAPTA
ncbi:TetR/AcrR family transcriptional regulator [Cerasicoccus frondis]|uniref:TetR/AcrR family transcriptional regulator n=1 Tax=Cerasicoccus frondis TaxID=490090 RepID=UPI00285275DF|nr:TetR/AcrR family transcriptional regulator [Cerasicoccus frondis]